MEWMIIEQTLEDELYLEATVREIQSCDDLEKVTQPVRRTYPAGVAPKQTDPASCWAHRLVRSGDAAQLTPEGLVDQQPRGAVSKT